MDLIEIKKNFQKKPWFFYQTNKKRNEKVLLKRMAKNESNISMFKPANDEFYEYSYYEKSLKSQI